MQYTLRNVPTRLDRALREAAAKEKKSLNRVVIEALERGAGLSPETVKYRDLSDLAGTWVEDEETNKVLAEQRQIDPDLWHPCD